MCVLIRGLAAIIPENFAIRHRDIIIFGDANNAKSLQENDRLRPPASRTTGVGRVKKLGTSVELRVCALILFFVMMPTCSAAQTNPETVEKGSFKLHMLLHAVGEETYEIKRAGSDELVMSVSSELTDRSNKRSIAATLRMKTDLTPTGFEQDRGGVRARTHPACECKDMPR